NTRISPRWYAEGLNMLFSLDPTPRWQARLSLTAYFRERRTLHQRMQTAKPVWFLQQIGLVPHVSPLLARSRNSPKIYPDGWTADDAPTLFFAEAQELVTEAAMLHQTEDDHVSLRSTLPRYGNVGDTSASDNTEEMSLRSEWPADTASTQAVLQ